MDDPPNGFAQRQHDGMDDSTRDWPTPLKLNAAAVELAPMIYYQAARVWGTGQLWDALSQAGRQRYITEAYLALRACAPKSERPRLVVR